MPDLLAPCVPVPFGWRRVKQVRPPADRPDMDGVQIERLRERLRETGWWTRALSVGQAVRSTRTPGGLLVVGPPEDEPWHLTAHLDDEARYGGFEQLRPTLVRWAPAADAPPHL